MRLITVFGVAPFDRFGIPSEFPIESVGYQSLPKPAKKA